MMRYLSLGLLIIFCAMATEAYPQDKRLIKCKASFYSGYFQGRTTSNGEIFDQKKLTAAHKSLPFGSLVKVTNLDNLKSVIVRINDRGPFYKKRCIDLSYEAAKKIDLIDAGVAMVLIECLYIPAR